MNKMFSKKYFSCLTTRHIVNFKHGNSSHDDWGYFKSNSFFIFLLIHYIFSYNQFKSGDDIFLAIASQESDENVNFHSIFWKILYRYQKMENSIQLLISTKGYIQIVLQKWLHKCVRMKFGVENKPLPFQKKVIYHLHHLILIPKF